MDVGKRQFDSAGRAAFRRGFTFLEVLFAVIILGIGLIMLAGMFPVAIQQQRASVDDSAAPAIGGGAVATISATFTSVDTAAGAPTPPLPLKRLSDLLLATGDTQHDPSDTAYKPLRVFSFRDVNLPARDRVWSLISGNMVIGADQSLAWVPFYMRDTDTGAINTKLATSVRLIVVPVRVRNKGRYDTVADTGINSGYVSGRANLEPNLVSVSVNGATIPNTITITDKSPGTTNGSSAAVAPGTYVIIADDQSVGAIGAANGFYFQVGAFVASSGSGSTWELVLGKDLNAFSSRVTKIGTADAFFVGMAPDSPSTYSGTSQETGVYNSIISLPAN